MLDLREEGVAGFWGADDDARVVAVTALCTHQCKNIRQPHLLVAPSHLGRLSLRGDTVVVVVVVVDVLLANR